MIKVYKFQVIDEVALFLAGGVLGFDLTKLPGRTYMGAMGAVGLVGQTVTFLNPAGSVTFVAGADPGGVLLFQEIRAQILAALPTLTVRQISGRLAIVETTPTTGVSVQGDAFAALLGFDGSVNTNGKRYNAPLGAVPPAVPYFIQSYASPDNTHVVYCEELQMSNFDKMVGVPAGEGAAAFLRLKNFEKTAEGYAPPDESGQLEGPFTAPVPEVIQLMATMVENEFKTMLAYKVYAESLRGLSHGSIGDEFDEHSENEIEHAEWLMKRMAVLGGPVQVPDIPAPPASADPVDIIQTMIRMEQEGIAKWNVLHSMVGDNPMKYKIEEYLTTEQHHLDELWQMLPPEARASVETGTPDPGQAKQAMNVGTPADVLARNAPHLSNARVARFLGKMKGHQTRTKQLLTDSQHAEAAVANIPRAWGSPLQKAQSHFYDTANRATKTNFNVGEAADEANRILSERGAGLKKIGFQEKQAWGFGGGAGRVGGLGSSVRSMFRAAEKPIAGTSASMVGNLAKNVSQPFGHAQTTENLFNQMKTLGKTPAPINTAAAAANMHKGTVRGAVGQAAGAVGGAADKARAAFSGVADKAKGWMGSLSPTARMQSAYAGKFASDMTQEEKVANFRTKLASSIRELKEKGEDRAMANLSAKAHMHEGTRGEQYGDLAGRLLGAAGGAAVGAKLGPEGKKLLSGLGSAALGQHLGGKAGKVLGKEVDTHRTKKAGVKISFDDAQGMLAYEQAAAAAEQQNEARFFQERARQAQAEKEQMEQQLQQAVQSADEKDQQFQAAQATIATATDASTKAMMQAVQAQQEAIKNKQLATDTTISMDQFRQKLRELADGGGSPGGPGDITAGGPGAPVGGNQGQPPMEGPAGQSPTPGTADASPPEGSNAPESRTESPKKPEIASASEKSQEDPPNQDGSKVNIKVGAAAEWMKQVGAAMKPVGEAAKSRLPGAAVGALLGGGAAAYRASQGTEGAQARVKELEGQGGGGFSHAMQMAKAKAHLAFQEAVSNHPEMGMAAGALSGAMTGAAVGPEVGQRIGSIGSKMKFLMGGAQ